MNQDEVQVEGSEVPLEEVTPGAEENALTQQDGLGEPDAQGPSTAQPEEVDPEPDTCVSCEG